MTPVSAVLAKRYGALDTRDPRKVHRSATPRWGGIGILSSILVGFLCLYFFNTPFRQLLQYSQNILRNGDVVLKLNLGEQLAGIIFGVVLLFIVGLIDDVRPMRSGMKFLFQIIAAMGAMIYGVRIFGLSVPGFEAYAHFPVWLTMFVTVMWLVGMTNAVNLIDGLDGLAAGVVAIISMAFIAVVLIQADALRSASAHQLKMAGVIAAVMAGATLGFLVYNFHPAVIFMGDGGSMTLGFLVGCIAVTGTFKTTILAVLLVPFVLVAVPIVDMTMVFVRRVLNKQSPFTPDRGHLHHKLLDSGWTHREVVLLIYVVTLILALISLTVVGIKKT